MLPPPVLRVEDIAKTFGGARALAGVGFDVRAGEVHGLLGKNGSGKSTLVKILAGFHAPDPGGRLEINGKAVDLPLRPGDFRRLGLAFLHQNLGLVSSLTVLENLRVGSITRGRRRINWRRERAEAAAALARYEVAVDPSARIARLAPVDRALVGIVRAVEDIRQAAEASGQPGLLVLDEPTPFLPRASVGKLFAIIRRIVLDGSGVVFISHDIDEVMEITDRVTVLRDGIAVGTRTTREASHGEIVEMIVGRRIASTVAVRPERAATHAPFARTGSLAGRSVEDVGFAIGHGEVLGLTGLIGSGYEEVPYLLFGARACRRGWLDLAGTRCDLRAMAPRRAIDLGMALLPGDRQGASGVDALPVVDNLFLPDVARFFRAGRLRRGQMMTEALQLGRRYEVQPNDPRLRLAALSGGNAQKVLIARWMNMVPKLLLLDEPTQGVDVGTRQQIFAALREAAGRGMAVLCASSDTEQLAEICDRVLVFTRGRITVELTGQTVSKDGIAEACYATMTSLATAA
jgi:ribose transport system ATP-binding protein